MQRSPQRVAVENISSKAARGQGNRKERRAFAAVWSSTLFGDRPDHQHQIGLRFATVGSTIAKILNLRPGPRGARAVSMSAN